VPQPFTPEAGESWSKEDIDFWIDVLAEISREAYTDPDVVKSAPHNQTIHRVDATHLEDPDQWATTWRAHVRKHPVGPTEA
jgi:glycine dehydrogenase subunit 2